MNVGEGIRSPAHPLPFAALVMPSPSPPLTPSLRASPLLPRRHPGGSVVVSSWDRWGVEVVVVVEKKWWWAGVVR